MATWLAFVEQASLESPDDLYGAALDAWIKARAERLLKESQQADTSKESAQLAG